MIAYQYNRTTGFFLSQTDCDPDPLTPGGFLVPGSATLTPPPFMPAGKRAKWVDGEWELADAPLDAPPSPALTPEEILEREREGMRPFAKAFFDALELFPASGFLHMLDRYTNTVEAVRSSNRYADLARWDQRVTIVLRVHPDMEAFRVSFGLSPELLDLIFRTAVMLDNGAQKPAAQAFAQAGLAALKSESP